MECGESIRALKASITLPLLLLGVMGHSTIAMAQSAGTFTPTGSMTTARMSHTATLLADGRVLIAGGHVFSNGIWSGTWSAELYDPSTGIFTATGHMATSRLSHSATLLPDGRVLIAGGLDGQSDPIACAAYGAGLPGMCQGSPLAIAELFDPATGTFTATGGMLVARGAPTATLLPSGRVLIAGGLDGKGHYLTTAELYDPQAGTFTATGAMVTGARADTATLLADGRVLIADGSSAELYDPSAGTFTAGGHTTTTGPYYTATLLPDGKVLIVGGFDGESDPLWTAELYDPRTDTFAATSDMTTASFFPFPGVPLGRVFQTSTPLPDGTVVIAGGWPNYGPDHHDLTSAELYDPLAGTFGATGDMATGRALHTATLLDNGSVLITGGVENYLGSGPPRVLDSTELYHPAVLAPAPVLFSLSGDGRGQGAIQHAGTYRIASADDPAVAGEYLSVYLTGLADGSVIPPQVAIGGRLAEITFFGNVFGYLGLNVINVRMPSGVAPGPAVPVRLNYLSRPSNEVSIGVR